MPLTKVTSGVIAANAVVDSFGSQSITGDKIGLNAITGNTLASNIINANNIVNGTITGVKIAANTITGDDIGQNAISANNIATNAIENYTALTNRPISNRNIIINGAMTVVQRNANTTAISTAGYYSPDRWILDVSSAGTWSMNVDSVGVNRAGPNEFGNSCNLICTTADSSLGAGDNAALQQRFEGLNLQQIKKGTANAESVTVSFWVKSSNTGTFICEMFDDDNQRQCSQSYTISTAGTWERKTITFPADTTGRFDNDNNRSLYFYFWLVAGTTFSSGTLNTSWASNTNANRAVGQFNLAGNINNYIAITGVQMELGTVATPFEMRSYQQELALCQRYYYSFDTTTLYAHPGSALSTNTSSTRFYFPTTMRATPTGAFTGTVGLSTSAWTLYNGGNYQTVTAITISNPNRNSMRMEVTTSSGVAASDAILVYCFDNNGGASLTASAEL